MAGVIKADAFEAGRKFSFQKLEAYGEQLIEHARQKAAEIIREAHQQAQEEVQQAKQAAHDQGLVEGRDAGMEQVLSEAREAVKAQMLDGLNQSISAINQGISEFESAKRRLVAQGETGLIELAVAIARRICKRVPEMSPDATIANVKQVLEVVGREADLELHINPEEEAVLREWAAGFVAQCESLEHVDIVADADVSRGGCRIVGKHVKVDATIERQLDRIVNEICPSIPDETETQV